MPHPFLRMEINIRMKKSFLKLFSLTLVAVIASCDNKIEVGDKFETSADKPFEVQIAGEEKAIETFNNFRQLYTT